MPHKQSDPRYLRALLRRLQRCLEFCEYKLNPSQDPSDDMYLARTLYTLTRYCKHMGINQGDHHDYPNRCTEDLRVVHHARSPLDTG